MPAELPSASLLENARLNAFVIVPNAVQGLFRRRRAAVAAATKAGVDRWAVGLLRGMKRSYDGGPVWVRVVRDRALLLLSTDDVRRALAGSPDPFASDPEAKRRGMSHFQPHALTISRGELWEKRRRFTEAVLDSGEPVHRLADRFARVSAEEVARMLTGPVAMSGGKLEWDALHGAVQRTARRLILGDAAAEDEGVTDLLGALMSEANGMPSKRSERFEPFMARIGEYVAAAETGSLVGQFGEAPSNADTDVAGQVPHWMFALGDTLAINLARALALLASHPTQRVLALREISEAERDGASLSATGVAGLSYVEACLTEAMRLWPTTPILSRETLSETEWNGALVPAGTQVLIVNTFNHRDPDSHEYADRFEPEAWTEGAAAEDWSFNHLSHGPQGCPGSGIALFVGKAILAELMASHEIRLLEPDLDPDRPLPHMLDFFGIRVAFEGA